jgi:hypothetical protein
VFGSKPTASDESVPTPAMAEILAKRADQTPAARPSTSSALSNPTPAMAEMLARDQFYETLFQPKNLRINFEQFSIQIHF